MSIANPSQTVGNAQLDRQAFDRDGFAGPFPLIPSDEVDGTTDLLRRAQQRSFQKLYLNPTPRWRRLLRYFPWWKRQYSQIQWFKGAHTCESLTYRLCTSPRIVDKLQLLIGGNILAWGSILIDKPPGEHHGWHADIEHLEWNGISVWVGLKNVSPSASLSVISGSHRLHRFPQKLQKSGLDVHDDEQVLKAAREEDPRCRLVDVKVRPGEFVIFHGRLWHEARNRSEAVRTSLVFQYCPPQERVKIPLTYSPPVRWHACPPPCCLAKGVDDHKVNWVVPAPDVDDVNNDSGLRS